MRRSASPHRRRRRASRRRYRVGDRAKYRCSHSRWRRKSCVGPKSLSTGAKIAHRHERLLTHVPAERIEVMSESVAVVSAYLPSALSSPKWRSTGGRPKKKAADQSTTQALRGTDAGQRLAVGHSLDARDIASVISDQSVQAGQFFFFFLVEPRLLCKRRKPQNGVPEQEASKGSEPVRIGVSCESLCMVYCGKRGIGAHSDADGHCL